MSVLYPLYVLLDDRRMTVIESPDRILYHLEAIDIENDEYLFWDSTEKAVRITIEKNKVAYVSYCDSSLALRDAFLSYVDAVGLPRTLVEGKPADIFSGIKEELQSRWNEKSWFARLLDRL